MGKHNDLICTWNCVIQLKWKEHLWIPFKENRMAEKQIMVKIDHVSKEYRLGAIGEQHYGKIWNDSMQK